jgi:hypothetical protein
VVAVVDHEIIDFGGSANGRPDPGETVDLIATLKNFGPLAANVEVELDTTDPNITILDGSSVLGDVASGEVVDTSGDPFTFEVAANAPTGHIVVFSLLATFTGGETPSDAAVCIGKFDFLVWDPTGDQSSGPVIAATLAGRHYSGSYRENLPFDRMDDYATLWVSVGIFADNFVVDGTGPEGPAIVNFMANGGSVYLEGGDVWAYDPGLGGFDFGPHFGIIGSQDGTGDMSHVLGAAGEFTEGMDFTYVGENSYMDRLVPTGDGFAVLTNSSPVYNCAVAADAGTYRTVGASFEFAGLQDGAGPSTKVTLASAIMDFFGVVSDDVLFADGFESGDTTAWGVTSP